MLKRNSFAAFIIVLTASASQGDDLSAGFVTACTGAQKDFTGELCRCVYDGLHNAFSEQQMTRISGLFAGNVTEAKESLSATGSASDADILEKLDLVEGAVEGCYSG